MIIEQFCEVMGYHGTLIFDIAPDAVDGRDISWYVDDCHMQLDVGGGRMSVDGAMLDVLTDLYAERITEELRDNMAEDYWTERWAQCGY